MERSNHSKVWKHFAQNDDQANCRQWRNCRRGRGTRLPPGRLNVENGLPC